MPKNNREAIFQNNRSQNTNDGGKSGSFFFFTEDKKFLVKTMPKNERIIYLEMLTKFYQHFKDNRGSMLAKMYGIYTVRLQGMNPIDLMIMGNSIRKTSPSNSIPYKFDLKGSKIKRSSLPNKIHLYSKRSFDLLTKSQVLKDLDFRLLANKGNSNLVNISILDRRRVILAMKNDIDFLESQGIMDYSLLLAVEHVQTEKFKNNEGIDSDSEIMFSKEQ